MNYGIIVAGGKSERMGPSVDKAFLSLGNKPVLAYSLLAFEHCPLIDGVILVVRKDRLDGARSMVQMYGCNKVKKVVAGGAQRQVSVMNGLSAFDEEIRIVSIHDGARPCVSVDVIAETIQSAKRYGSGVAAVKVTDTIKSVDRGVTVDKTLDRSKLWAVQTPQTFKYDLLMNAYECVQKKKLSITDDASAVELTKGDVRLVPSDQTNIKITTPGDLALAATLLGVG
jgi:2-C-methyl-D-erythritol 4-phosphate cytidylyltransferase